MVSNIWIDKLHFKREISVDACFWNVKLYGLVWMTKEYICTNESSVKKKLQSKNVFSLYERQNQRQRKAICFSLILFLKSSDYCCLSWKVLIIFRGVHWRKGDLEDVVLWQERMFRRIRRGFVELWGTEQILNDCFGTGIDENIWFLSVWSHQGRPYCEQSILVSGVGRHLLCLHQRSLLKVKVWKHPNI